MNVNLIKEYFYISNYITLCSMYLNEYSNSEQLHIEKLKKNNPGHLGSSLGINFLIANLNYFLNQNNLTSKLIIGTGHAGISLISNLWLSGELKEKYPKYQQTKAGLNHLIEDFGKSIRAEINPEYPNTIYDGGELGYSLSVAYGYAMNANEDIIPCIIGDGECETGTISASWYLNKLLNTKSKVLPIINLNGLKMGSPSYFQTLTNQELIKYFESLGFYVEIIEVSEFNSIEEVIESTQIKLKKSLENPNPLIIFKSPKGYTIPDYETFKVEGEIISHKNPLSNIEETEKLKIIKAYLEKYYLDFFDRDNFLLPKYTKYFKQKDILVDRHTIIPVDIKKIEKNLLDNVAFLEAYLNEFLKLNEGMIFSPDELHSNKIGRLSNKTFEILNENVLQGLIQGYIQSGNNAFFIGYEGFMPIISSMLSQYYKYLLQKSKLTFSQTCPSLNYILTSTCWENTYSHQNPSFVNDLLMKNDALYNILYPKDGNNLIKCLEEISQTKDKINIITISKRQKEQYQTYSEANSKIDIIIHNDNPELILCATGDYMLSQILEVHKQLKDKYRIKIVYVTNPKILDIESKEALTNQEFNKYFNKHTKVIYLFCGYSYILKSLLYERNVDFNILGYNDQITVFGALKNNLKNNGLSIEKIIEICENEINRVKIKRRI